MWFMHGCLSSVAGLGWRGSLLKSPSFSVLSRALWWLLLGISQQSFAQDNAILYRFKGDLGINEEHTRVLLASILEATQSEYGPFNLKMNNTFMVRERLRLEMEHGDIVNVVAVSPSRGWDNCFRVGVPIRRGLGSYRMFVVRGEDESLFKSVNAVALVKQYRTGAVKSWATGGILEAHDFNVVYGPSVESLFSMLSMRRFDTLMRGLNEIYDELLVYQALYPNLVVEKNAAIFTYFPNYFYVSPKRPRLAERIAKGMQLVVANGEYFRLFEQYYGDDLRAANLTAMKIFYVDNQTIPSSYYQADAPYLLDFKMVGVNLP